MHKLLAVAALLAAAPIVLAIAPAGAGGIAPPPSAGAGGHAIVLVGGMGGGSSGGMGGSPGGMGGGSFGGMGGGRSGYGGMFGGPTTESGRPAEAFSGSGGNPSDNYTYRCVTASGLCPFVAPAALRATSLRSGADCFCADGRTRGRVE